MEKDAKTLSGWLEAHRKCRYETISKGSSESTNPDEEDQCRKKFRLETSKGLV